MTSFAAFSLQYPRASEEHVPLSSHQGSASAFPGGLLVDTNLDTSSPDTYRPPPAPIPYSVTLVVTPPSAHEISDDKANASLHSSNPNSVQETVTSDNRGTSAKLEQLKESECKDQGDLELDSAKDSEIELKKLAEPIGLAEEEDVCPICLEGDVVTRLLMDLLLFILTEYDAENPKLSTKCDHHFHLACILEWMERSESCPVCDQDVIFNPPLD
ncbi:putative E3 ubiquitin-protein ligase RHB1A isoform X1 [Senna tora]|uniref:RING-type E3 ubiquitin transferase n=1 Tax=Senna tora TaxID=362788 RepID=A0A834TXN6_9FABA|nr:putative E3 ubiquitin-protein ligase RHB1A isoform X1 [Senna tora]